MYLAKAAARRRVYIHKWIVHFERAKFADVELLRVTCMFAWNVKCFNTRHRHFKSFGIRLMITTNGGKRKITFGIWNVTIDKDGHSTGLVLCEEHQLLRRYFLAIADDCLLERTWFVHGENIGASMNFKHISLEHCCCTCSSSSLMNISIFQSNLISREISVSLSVWINHCIHLKVSDDI